MDSDAPVWPGGSQARMQIGEWFVDAEGDCLLRSGQTIKLEPRLMRLLVCLAASPGRVIPVPELLASVWADVVVTPESAYQAIAALRRALGDDGNHTLYIATVPRKGYRLVAEVRVTDAMAFEPVHTTPPAEDRAPGVAAIAQPALDSAAPAMHASEAMPSRWRTTPYQVAAALSAAVLLIIGARMGLDAQHSDDLMVVGAEPAKTQTMPWAGSQTQGTTGARKTVLWVDDQPANNQLEREAMARFGIEFVLALSTEEALQLLSTRRFDLVISDQWRGEEPKAGFALLTQMRMQRGDRTPFVLYTSECSSVEMMEARALGALACATLVSELMQSALAALESRP